MRPERRPLPDLLSQQGSAHKPAVDRLANSILGRSPMTGASRVAPGLRSAPFLARPYGLSLDPPHDSSSES